jgi:hypothetical protein
MSPNPELLSQIYARTIRHMPLERRRIALATLLAAVVGLLLWGAGPGAAPARAAEELVGTFRITAGRCSGGTASGSYFRMVQPTGSTKDGPWVDNGDSACADGTYTPLSPGTDGGLVTGTNQPAPNPGFDGSGNSLAVRIIHPVRFFGVDFSASTNATDLQTGTGTATPVLRSDDGRLSGDLSAFAATWNKQAFNQGAPKPGGSTPGGTQRPTGTYNAATRAFSLTWASQIVGGPFNNFTGLWHLEGTFVPAGVQAAPSAGSTGGTTPTSAVAAATGDDATATTTAPAPAGSDDEVAAPSAPAKDSSADLASRVRVDDEGFQAATWLVVLLAGLGLAGVLALLLIGGRSATSSEGSPS